MQTTEYKPVLNRVDFHVHLNPEDSLESLANAAKRTNVVGMAVIVRNSLPPDIDSKIQYLETNGIKTIPGVEFSNVVGDAQVDLVALGFKTDDSDLQHFFGPSEEKNSEIVKRQKKFLESKGFKVQPVETDTERQILLDQLVAGKNPVRAFNLCKIIVSNPENSQLIDLLKVEHPDVYQEIYKRSFSETYLQDPNTFLAKFLFECFFTKDKEGFIPTDNLEERMKAVHNAGGVVIYSPEETKGGFQTEVFNELLELGIDGVYGWHGGKLILTREQIKAIRKKGLMILGGSDYDSAKSHWQIGLGSGEMQVGVRRLEEFNKYLQKRKNS